MGTFAAQGQPEAVAELIAFNRTNPATPIDQASRIYGRFAPLNEPASQERAARGAGGADEVTR